jgi:hypothetical protein
MRIYKSDLRHELAEVSNPMNKGNETGDIAKDGYRVISRARDDYRRYMRREDGECSHSRMFEKDD